MIAGLLRPDRGPRDRRRDARDVAGRVHIPAHRRRIGYVFQDARLFPLSMSGRISITAGGLNRLGRDPAQRTRVTDLLDIGHLLERRPGNYQAVSVSA